MPRLALFDVAVVLTAPAMLGFFQGFLRYASFRLVSFTTVTSQHSSNARLLLDGNGQPWYSLVQEPATTVMHGNYWMVTDNLGTHWYRNPPLR